MAMEAVAVATPAETAPTVVEAADAWVAVGPVEAVESAAWEAVAVAVDMVAVEGITATIRTAKAGKPFTKS